MSLATPARAAMAAMSNDALDKLIGVLTLAEIVEKNGAGFAVICQKTADNMTMARNGQKA